MATYNSLTIEQQARLEEFSLLLRPWCGEIARLNNHGDAINSLYNAEVSAILTALDGAEDIPNPTGFTDASPLSRDQMVTIVSYIQNMLTSYNTAAHRQNYARAAGADELIG